MIPQQLRTCFVLFASIESCREASEYCSGMQGHFMQCLACVVAFSVHSCLANEQNSAQHSIWGRAASITLKAALWKKGNCSVAPSPAYYSCSAEGKPFSWWGCQASSSPNQQCQELILAALGLHVSVCTSAVPECFVSSLLPAKMQPLWEERRWLSNSMSCDRRRCA